HCLRRCRCLRSAPLLCPQLLRCSRRNAHPLLPEVPFHRRLLSVPPPRKWSPRVSGAARRSWPAEPRWRRRGPLGGRWRARCRGSHPTSRSCVPPVGAFHSFLSSLSRCEPGEACSGVVVHRPFGDEAGFLGKTNGEVV